MYEDSNSDILHEKSSTKVAGNYLIIIKFND